MCSSVNNSPVIVVSFENKTGYATGPTVNANALFTHFNVDRSKNVLMLTGCLVANEID